MFTTLQNRVNRTHPVEEDPMNREDLKDLIRRVIERLGDTDKDNAPRPACFYGDQCDATTKYGISEEA